MKHTILYSVNETEHFDTRIIKIIIHYYDYDFVYNKKLYLLSLLLLRVYINIFFYIFIYQDYPMIKMKRKIINVGYFFVWFISKY